MSGNGSSTVSRTWVARMFHSVRRAFVVSFVVLVVLLVTMVLVTVFHVAFHVCPLYLTSYDKSGVVPVVYGLPTPETFEKAQRGEAVLGGCTPSLVGGVCPLCGWPVVLHKPNTNYIGDDE